MTIRDIYASCLRYNRLATQGSSSVSNVVVIENTDPILKQLSDLKSFDERLELAGEHFSKLGEGSARAVYRISEELIIKVATNDKGLAQCQVESQLDLQKSCANPVIVADPNGKWLITYYTDSMTKDDFKEKIGFGFDAFMSCLFFAFNNEGDRKEPREYDAIKKHPLFLCLSKMIIDGSLLIGDIEKPSSFGIRDGRIVLRDSGFSKGVWSRFYKDKSHSETNPKSST